MPRTVNINGNTLRLILNTAVSATAPVTLSYRLGPGSLRDTLGNFAAIFDHLDVTNTAPMGVNICARPEAVEAAIPAAIDANNSANCAELSRAS